MPNPKDKTGKPNTENEEVDSQKKEKKGCCKKKKKEEEEPKEKKKKGCCKKEKKDAETEGKKKNSGCCKKKKQPEKDEEEQSKVDEEECSKEPHVHVCNCCIFVSFGGRKNACTPRSSSTRKCCDCKCKWKQFICIITWIVIIICFIFGLVFCIGFYEFVEVVLDQHDYITWIMIASYIWFVFASSVFFLIVTKLQCATRCCLACKVIWFLVLHIPFGCITLILIYLTANPTREEAFNAHILETKMNEEHYWLAYLQEQYECCFTTEDGTQFGNPHITETCEKYVDKDSRKKKNVYDIEFNEIAVQRCDYLLYEIYDDTMTMGGIFTIVLLIIGVIPFVIYTIVYVKQSKIVPKDEEDTEKEDEETSEGESKDKNKKKPKQDNVDENNNVNQKKDKEAKQKSLKEDKARKSKEKPKKNDDKTKQEPKKDERKKDQKPDKK